MSKARDFSDPEPYPEDHVSTNYSQVYLDQPPSYPPPPYSTLEPVIDERSSRNEPFFLDRTVAPESSATISRTVVIPRITKSFKGPFYTPFLRAYSPAIESSGISKADFLAFIDGLNEAFIASSVLEAGNAVGDILSFVPLPSVQYAGMGVQLASGLSSAGISYFRTRSYLKAANETVFGPKGLHVTVMGTKHMIAKIGMNPEQARRPLFNPDFTGNDGLHQQQMTNYKNNLHLASQHVDPLQRRLEALKGYIAPLTLEQLPERVEPSNIIKKLNASFAARQEQKITKKMAKREHKGRSEQAEHYEDAEDEGRKADRDIAEIEEKIVQKQSKATSRLNDYDSPRERAKIERELSRDLRRLEREKGRALHEKEKKMGRKFKKGDRKSHRLEEKEDRITRRIQWVVILNKDEELPDDEIREDSD